MNIGIIDADLIGKSLGRNGLMKPLEEFEKEYPEIAQKYFDIKCGDFDAN
jgi:hypothetical protein